MTESPSDVVHAGGVEKGFWVMTPPGLDLNTLVRVNGKYLTPAKLLPVLLPNTSPFCAFYNSTVSQTILWVLYPEHVGYFLNETHTWNRLRTYGPKVCEQWDNCQMIDLTVSTKTEAEAEGEEPTSDVDEDGADEEIEDEDDDEEDVDGTVNLACRIFNWARRLVFRGEKLDWDSCSKDDQAVPQHICYLFLCDTVVGAVKLIVPPSVLAPVYGLAKSAVLPGNHKSDCTYFFTKPMFPCINKTYKLFQGFDLIPVFQGTKKIYESAVEYDSSSGALLWNHQTMMKLVDNSPQKAMWWNYLHPSFKSRMTNRPNMFRESEVGSSMPCVHDAEKWLQSDAFFCHLQGIYLTAFRMIMPSSVWYKPVAPNVVDLGSLRMVQNRIATLLAKHTDTVMNIDGCKVTFGMGFGEVGLCKGKAKAVNNQKKYGDMIKVMMSRNPTGNLIGFFGEKPVSISDRIITPELCTDFQIFGLWSAKNKYRGFTSVGTEGINASGVPELREVEVLLDNDVCPFCCLSLSIAVRQLVLGEIAGHMTWLIQEGKMTPGGMKEAVKSMMTKGFGMSNFFNFGFPDRGADSVHSSEMTVIQSYVKDKMFRQMPSNRNIRNFLLKSSKVPVLARGKSDEVAGYLDHVKINKKMCYVPVVVQRNNYLQAHELILSKPQYYNRAPCLVKCYWRAFFGNTTSRNTKLSLNFGTNDYRVTIMGNDHLSTAHTTLSGNVGVVKRPEIMAAEAVLSSLKTELYVEDGVTKLNVRTVNSNVPDVTKAMWEDLKKVMAEQNIVLNEDEKCSDSKDAVEYDTDTDENDTNSFSNLPTANEVSDDIMNQSAGFTTEYNLSEMDELFDVDTNGSLDEGKDEPKPEPTSYKRLVDADRKRKGHGYQKPEKQARF